jgi:hypothetical protein
VLRQPVASLAAFATFLSIRRSLPAWVGLLASSVEGLPAVAGMLTLPALSFEGRSDKRRSLPASSVEGLPAVILAGTTPI